MLCRLGFKNRCRQETQNTRTQQETEVWHSVCHTAPLYLLTKQVTKNLPITHTEGVREMGGNIDKETIAAARVSKGLSCSLLPDPALVKVRKGSGSVRDQQIALTYKRR